MEPAALAEVTEWLEKYRQLWESNFQRLDALLDELKATGRGAKSVDRGANARPKGRRKR